MTSVSSQWSLAATADFDGNGTPDLLWHNQNTGDVYVWYMDGSSSVGAAYIATVSPVWRLAATPDINGDGRTDIVWHNQSTGDVYAWLMNGATNIGAAFMGTVPAV